MWVIIKRSLPKWSDVTRMFPGASPTSSTFVNNQDEGKQRIYQAFLRQLQRDFKFILTEYRDLYRMK